MTVIGTVGLPGSGKGEAANVAREAGVPVVTMGDVIRQECRDRGLDPARNHGEIAQALREENGPDAIAQRSLPIVREHLADDDVDTVLVDGLRSGVEADRFEDAFGDDWVLVSIEAPFEVREQRIDDRGRDETGDDGESLQARDERELGFGMQDAMDRADVTIHNTATLERFRAQIEALLAGGPSALEDADEVDA
jgi:dephospho-CoA kinase